jgi:hypothetical protein
MFCAKATFPLRILTKSHQLHKLGTMNLAKQGWGMLQVYRYCRMMAEGKLILITSQKSLQNHIHAGLKKILSFRR